MALYQIVLMGAPDADSREMLRATLATHVSAFGFEIGREVAVLDGSEYDQLDPKAATTAAYFTRGASPATELDSECVIDLLRRSVPIIPVIGPTDRWERVLPPRLSQLNGLRLRPDDEKLHELSCALLECVGLLRRQRRVFISYRRTESRNAAVQLHDSLVERGFDVFLDTHSLRPGDPFQDVLWHRMVDSDVVIMLDTPGYFDSKWTRQELGRARACDVSILRILWPEHRSNRSFEQFETIGLSASDLTKNGQLRAATVASISTHVEALRSRGIGARYLLLSGKIQVEAEKVGGRFEGIGANRAIAIAMPEIGTIYVYPVVGIPTADVINEIANNLDRARLEARSLVVYQPLGIRNSWRAHLDWLNERLNAPKTSKINEVGWDLVGMDS